MSNRFDEGDEPAIRDAAVSASRHLVDYPCPYCAENTLLISISDISNDPYRVELYCDNDQCDVREMVVLAMRMDGPVAWKRADARALNAIDEGTDEEQEADGYDLHRDAEGNPTSRSIKLGDLLATSSDAPLKRRSRNSKIRIEPEPEDEPTT